jgi:putative oxidoreductase
MVKRDSISRLMQRSFSSFADGWPGAGLLLLRVSAGVGLFHSGVASIGLQSQPVIGVVRVIGAAAGVVLVAGFLTPLAGVLAAVAETWIGIAALYSHSGDPWSAMGQAALAAALAMIGPGAWSIDARRFGRKRIYV